MGYHYNRCVSPLLVTNCMSKEQKTFFLNQPEYITY